MGAAGVPDVPRRRDIGADIDQHRNDLIADVQADALGIVDTVLQTQNDGIRREMRRHLRRRILGVETLHAEQHHVSAAERGHVRRRTDRDALLGVAALQQQTVPFDRIDVTRTSD